MHAKEVKQYLAEKAKRDEAYYNEAIDAGFDDMHYYDDYITRGCFKWFIIIVVIIVIVLTGLIYLLK